MEKLGTGWLILIILAALALASYLIFFQPNFYLFLGKTKLAILVGVLLITGIVCLVTRPRR